MTETDDEAIAKRVLGDMVGFDPFRQVFRQVPVACAACGRQQVVARPILGSSFTQECAYCGVTIAVSQQIIGPGKGRIEVRLVKDA